MIPPHKSIHVVERMCCVTVDSVEIHWPSGLKHLFTNVDANQIVALKEDEPQFKRIK